MRFLDACPGKVDAEFGAVLDAVAGAPPPAFSGGGKWEAMHGDMGGYYEIRLTRPGREQFRLFCILENGTDAELIERGLVKPAIAVLTGLRKPWRTIFSANDYKGVRKLGSDYLARLPRRIATQHRDPARVRAQGIGKARRPVEGMLVFPEPAVPSTTYAHDRATQEPPTATDPAPSQRRHCSPTATAAASSDTWRRSTKSSSARELRTRRRIRRPVTPTAS